MSEKYREEFEKMSAKERNVIIRLVNEGVPKEEAKLSGVEEWYYDRMISYGKELEKKTGKFPTFELQEADYDDPALDIYRNEPRKK